MTARLVMVHVKAGTEGWFGDLRRRILSFCDEHDHDGPSGELVWAELVPHMFAEQPHMWAFVLTDENERSVGHVLLSFETDKNAHWLGVRQIASDAAVEQDAIDDMVNHVSNFALSIGLSEMRCLALSRAHERLYRANYGFETMRFVMRKKLEG